MADSKIVTPYSDEFSDSGTNQLRTPSGILIQWGTKSVASLTASATTNFTITFPTA